MKFFQIYLEISKKISIFTLQTNNKMSITTEEFEKLPANEQAFRWKLFIESDGHKKNLSKKRIKEIAQEYKVDIK